jgi:hypothetical protein
MIDKRQKYSTFDERTRTKVSKRVLKALNVESDPTDYEVVVLFEW